VLPHHPNGQLARNEGKAGEAQQNRNFENSQHGKEYSIRWCLRRRNLASKQQPEFRA